MQCTISRDVNDKQVLDPQTFLQLPVNSMTGTFQLIMDGEDPNVEVKLMRDWLTRHGRTLQMWLQELGSLGWLLRWQYPAGHPLQPAYPDEYYLSNLFQKTSYDAGQLQCVFNCTDLSVLTLIQQLVTMSDIGKVSLRPETVTDEVLAYFRMLDSTRYSIQKR